jgi:hypothetical protein
MIQEEKEGGKGFKVEDRRRFDDSGELKQEFKEDEEKTEVRHAPESPGGRPKEPALELSFSTFVMGLSTQALMHLGEIPDPVAHNIKPDFESARQMIDILGILQKKTEGNLEPDEKGLMETVLYDLRMRYVEKTSKG